MSHRERDRTAQERRQDASRELFSVLANETRIEILFALADAESEEGGPVPFSDIYQYLDIHDSSQFNYHLKALTDQFVQQTDDGYQLRYVGRLIYRAIKAGEYTGKQALEPTEIESRCYACDERLTARYDDGRLILKCHECGNLSYRITIPPSALINRTSDEFLQAADQRIRSDLTLAAHGVCRYCFGTLHPDIRDPSTAPTDNVYINHDCEQCEQRIISTTAGELFLSHPAVVAFCFEHDIDLFANPCWEIGICVSDEYTTILSEQPLRVQFELSLAGDTLRIVLDNHLNTVDVAVNDVPIES